MNGANWCILPSSQSTNRLHLMIFAAYHRLFWQQSLKCQFFGQRTTPKITLINRQFLIQMRPFRSLLRQFLIQINEALPFAASLSGNTDVFPAAASLREVKRHCAVNGCARQRTPELGKYACLCILMNMTTCT